MLLLRIPTARIIAKSASKAPQCPQWRALQSLLRPLLRRQFQSQCRRYSQKSATPLPKGSPVKGEDSKRRAEAAAQAGKQYEVAERLIIYHAGTGRTTFLAMIKVTSLFIGAFFCFLVIPSYVKTEKPLQETVKVALCGIVPIIFVAYTTAPFVTHIHIHLPPAARTSRTVLERFVRAMPSSTQLTLTTMSFIAKPRYSTMQAGELFPARQRLGVVNYVRDTTKENVSRKWYMYRAVGKFYIQDQSAAGAAAGSKGPRVRYQKKSRSVVDKWIWDVVKDKIGKRAAVKDT